MSAYSARNRGLSPAKKFIIFLLLMVLGGLGTTAALAAAGLVDVPMFSRREPSRVGWVLVPMSGRTVPIYALVQRDDLNDPATGLWKEVWLPKESISADTIIDRTKIIGRVLNHEKAAGFAFRETDFLPPGTRFGMVAGIPLGKRSVVCEAKKIGGIHALQKGDRFDLVVTIPAPKSNTPAAKAASSALPPAEPEVRVLVNNGAVVMPSHMRSTSDTTPSLMNGPRTTTKNVEEVAIAVDPEEIAGLTAALSSGGSITCVARSGHPDEPKTLSSTPGSTPKPPPIAIETVVGDSSSTMYFPNPTGEGAEQALVSNGRRVRTPGSSIESRSSGDVRQARRGDVVEPAGATDSTIRR
jgi:Flp pilus assembly protein CpaB